MTSKTARQARRVSSVPPIRLGINIDHIATLRNARGGRHPDPVRAAKLAVEAGADNITAHLREDRRHIRDDDIAQAHRRPTCAAQSRNGGDSGDAGDRACRRARMPAASCPSAARSSPPRGASTSPAKSARLRRSSPSSGAPASKSRCSSTLIPSRSKPRARSRPMPSSSIPALIARPPARAMARRSNAS